MLTEALFQLALGAATFSMGLFVTYLFARMIFTAQAERHAQARGKRK